MQKNLMKIDEESITKYEEKGFTTLTGFKVKVEAINATGKQGGYTGETYYAGKYASGGGTGTTKEVNMLGTFIHLDEKDQLLNDVENSVLRNIRKSIALYYTINDMYENQSGLKQLKDLNQSNRLTNEQKTEFHEKLNTSVLISTFVAANFIVFKLSEYEQTSAIDINIPTPQVSIKNTVEGINTFLYEIDKNIKDSAKDDASLVDTIIKTAEEVITELKLKVPSLKHTEIYESYNYMLESEEFEISGFETAKIKGSASLDMVFKKPEEVIGNAVAKHQASRLAKMMMAYDFKKKMNPFAEMGGFTFTFLGDGNPGTGKTTLIQMMAGLINDYAQSANYPFLYENFGIDQIDSYQGKSGQNAKAFIDRIVNPNIIGFGTIDDIDQVAGKRGDTQSSAGQQEVTAVLMEAFSGANTVIRGNCTFGQFSNYPENVDDALRQRAGMRFLIDGPQTEEDYIDILALLIGKNHTIDIGTNDLFATQEIKQAVKTGFEKFNIPHEERLKAVFNEVGNLNSIKDFGMYMKRIQELDPRFTGRAIKNITDAVKTRMMDFDMPDDWFENPELFMWKDYSVKTDMIKELMTPITPAMLQQEINRYADSELRYSNKSFDSSVEKAVNNIKIQEAAMKKISRRG